MTTAFQGSGSPRVLLLVTTASYRAGAFLAAAARLGVEVVVGSDRRQALADFHPGGHLTLDFSAPERAVPEIVGFAKRYPLAAVIAADDDGAVLGAMAALALGLRHNPVGAVAAACNKLTMREILSRAEIPSPSFERVSIEEHPERVAARLRYPCVVKPSFLSGSRGVMRADDPPGFVAAFRRLITILERPEVKAYGGLAAREVLVEDYVPGAEVALEGLLSEGRLRVLALFDKPDPLEGPYFEESLYVTPSRLPSESQAAVVACCARVCGALGLVTGPVHAELRINPRGAWIIEIAPRSIGGLCSRVLRFGEGVPLEELILMQALGLDTAALERERAAAGVMMIPTPRAGILTGVSGEPEALSVAGVEEVRIGVPLGREVAPPPEGSRYLGFIFARGASPLEVEQALREAHRRLRFTIAAASEAPVGTSASVPSGRNRS